MEQEKKYTVIELAELIGVPRTTINDWLSRYAPYIDFVMQGKRRVYPESSAAVLKEISALRNSGMTSADIEAELAKRHPLRAEPEVQEPQKTSSAPSSGAENNTAVATGADTPPQGTENEFQLIARRQSEELGKLIGDTFRDMAQRMEELERLNRAQHRRGILWMGGAALLLILLLFGTFLAYRTYRQTLLFSRENTELKQKAETTNHQLQELQRQSVELIAGSEQFRSNIVLLEKQLNAQKETFEKNINTIKHDFERAAAAHQASLAAEKEKHAAALKMKEAELALEKEKFASERLKFLRDIERMSSDNENVVNDLRRQLGEKTRKETQKTIPEKKQEIPPAVPSGT